MAYKKRGENLPTYLPTKHEATETSELVFLRDEANPQKGTLLHKVFDFSFFFFFARFQQSIKWV